VAFRLERGARPLADGGVAFSVWAPQARQVSVKVGERSVEMSRRDDGSFDATIPEVPVGTDYVYVIDGAGERPDPVSRHQPHGVHGPSRIVDPGRYQWGDENWPGLPLQGYVLYELHTGAFTPEGTFDAVIAKLDYLKAELGITAIELMPVAQFPGERNWGYDGAHLYAPQSSYGGPDALKRLVDACHRAGLAVVLDVVYNHLGPEGNYLGEYGPYFTDRYRTPWGNAINFDGPDSDEVRRYFVDNALYWLTEYHVDALRLDAVHGIFDFSARHILREIGDAFHGEARRLGRQAYLIAESDLNDVRVIEPRNAGGHAMDAQWNDDFHHALRTILTDDRHGYLGDFGSLADLSKALREGYVYDGRRSEYRRRRHGNSAKHRPGDQFVAFIQNHDQIANASAGRRLASIVDLERQKLAVVAVMAAPNIPLLFMGEEWGEVAPFHYFTSHGDPELAAAVSRGRREEMRRYGPDVEAPDPQDEATFLACKLDWSRSEHPPHAHVHRLYRDLIAVRRQHPCLAGFRKDLTRVTHDEAERWMVVRRGDARGAAAAWFLNFSDIERSVAAPASTAGWRLLLSTVDVRYGGPADGPQPPASIEARRRPTVRCPPSCALLYARLP